MQHYIPFLDTNKRRFPVLLTLAAFLVSSLAAQKISISIDTQGGRVDNLFGSRLVGDQFLTDGRVNLAYYLADDVRLTGSYYRSEVLTDNMYSYDWWQSGVQWRNLDSDRNQWYAGLYVAGNGYSDAYNYYNHSDLTGYLEWKFRPNLQRYARLGYDLRARSFPEEPQASNTVHRWYAVAQGSFNTGTSIQVGSDMSIQDFWAPPVVMARGNGFVGIPLYEELPANLLLAGNLLVSQSLHPWVGLSLQAGIQRRLNRNLTGANILDGLASPFLGGFRWDGYSVSGKLTFLLPWQLTLVPSLQYRERYYVDVPVYLYDFDTNTYLMEGEEYVISGLHRVDDYTNVQLEFKRDWPLRFAKAVDTFGTSLTLGWNRNQSNDPLFDYSGGSVTMGLHLNLDQ